MSKGKRDRFVKIPNSVIAELESYCKLSNDAVLFPSNRGGKLTTATIQAIVENSAKKANIKRDVYPHLLRHSFATHLDENGCDVKDIQNILGHSHIETTMAYVHMKPKINIKSPLDSLNG